MEVILAILILIAFGVVNYYIYIRPEEKRIEEIYTRIFGNNVMKNNTETMKKNIIQAIDDYENYPLKMETNNKCIIGNNKCIIGNNKCIIGNNNKNNEIG